MKRIIIALFVIAMTPIFSFGSNIKEPNVSGQFYTADPAKLSREIDQYIQSADVDSASESIEMIIAPHAGYMFSGGVAAHSFKAVQQKKVKTIVILAPSHFMYGFAGVSVWEEGGFRTPLGVVPVDQEFAKAVIESNENFYYEPRAYEREHSLEVELPFLQQVFSDFKIVPIIMGQATLETCENLAKALNKIIADRDDVLVVVSTDLSHYHNDAFARKMDRLTIDTVKTLDAKRIWTQCRVGTMEMCGFIPVTTALLLAKERNLSKVNVLKYANSGDVSGDKDRVVGYTAITFQSDGNKSNDQERISELSLEQKRQLIQIAKQAIEEQVRTGRTSPGEITDKRLFETEGAFVTIHKKGQLRGCIGNIFAKSPLYQTVHSVAISSATSDPRFPPVTQDELKDIDVEVSVLSKPRRITNVEEIEVGVHGVIVSQGPENAGVFLPQVATDWGWDRDELLSNLCSHKAGLPPDAWKDPKTKIEIFTADVFSEKDVE